MEPRPPNLPTVEEFDAGFEDMIWFYLPQTLLVIYLLTRWLFGIVSRAERLLEIEREKSEALLHRVLPESIAEKLKNTAERDISRRIPDVSILFADIVNFTSYSERAEPSDVVRTLNSLFSEFDRMVEQRGLEKIKMIGDAYMVAGGVPDELPDHRRAIVDLALEMRSLVRDNSDRFHGLNVRIGLNAGPVVAGVIGDTRFIYDLWGDAVNVASRMESHGIPGEIQVTQEIKNSLGDAFVYEPRGTIEVKGKGPMELFLVKGVKQT